MRNTWLQDAQRVRTDGGTTLSSGTSNLDWHFSQVTIIWFGEYSSGSACSAGVKSDGLATCFSLEQD